MPKYIEVRTNATDVPSHALQCSMG